MATYEIIQYMYLVYNRLCNNTVYILVSANNCPEITAQTNSHLSIAGNIATITCESDGATYEMTCIDNIWEGTEHRCTVLS